MILKGLKYKDGLTYNRSRLSLNSATYSGYGIQNNITSTLTFLKYKNINHIHKPWDVYSTVMSLLMAFNNFAYC